MLACPTVIAPCVAIVAPAAATAGIAGLATTIILRTYRHILLALKFLSVKRDVLARREKNTVVFVQCGKCRSCKSNVLSCAHNKGGIRFGKILCRACWMDTVEHAEGKTSVGYSAFLGYDKDFKINEEQAQVVKLIYKLFLGGRSFYAITKELEKRGLKSPSGKDKWYISTVRSILTNEKYRGDALIQKEYTADFLDKTRRKNTGEIPQYYVEEHHEAIIPPDLFDFVQSEIKRREQNGKHSGVSIFANKIKCGCCGGWYGAKVWHSTDKYRRVIYRCNKKYAHQGKPRSTRHLTEEEIKQIFVKALNSLVEVKENVIAELRSLIDDVCQTVELTEERNRVEQELCVLAERIEILIQENARVAQDQNAYLKQENEIRGLYVEKQGNLEKLDDQIAERESKRKTLETMIQVVCGINEEQVEFDEELWGGLLDHIVVKEDGTVVVVFKGGIEIGVGE